MLGIRAAMGRTLLPEDDRPGAELVVIVSNQYWRRDLRIGSPNCLIRGQASGSGRRRPRCVPSLGFCKAICRLRRLRPNWSRVLPRGRAAGGGFWAHPYLYARRAQDVLGRCKLFCGHQSCELASLSGWSKSHVFAPVVGSKIDAVDEPRGIALFATPLRFPQ